MIQEVSRNKYSEVDWLGSMPLHWKMQRNKDVAKIVDCKNRTPEFYEDGEHLVIRTSNVKSGTLNLSNPSFTNKYYFDEWTKRGIPPSGSILFTREAPVGEVCLVPSKYQVCLGQRMMNFIPHKEHNTSFFLYFFLSNAVAEYFSSITAGSTVHHLRVPQVFNIAVFTPPLPEQNAIADYLDIKIAQIDKKVRLLTQNVVYYDQLKQALINETVTHGLDKNVPLTDSGIKWIGDTPEHWKTIRVKGLFKELKAKSCTGNETLLSVSEYSGVTQKKDNMDEGAFLTNAETLIGYKICRINDLVINIMLAWKRGLGVSPYYGIVSPSYAVYTPHDLACSSYFHYLFRSERAIAEFKRNSTGIIESRLRLYSDRFYALSVSIPEYNEQKAIADYLDTKTAKIDTIVKTINTQIEKLKELRKTLINDVVTGQIKVV